MTRSAVPAPAVQPRFLNGTSIGGAGCRCETCVIPRPRRECRRATTRKPTSGSSIRGTLHSSWVRFATGQFACWI